MTNIELDRIARMFETYINEFPCDANHMEQLVKSHCVHSLTFLQAILCQNDLSDAAHERICSAFSRFFLSESFLLFEFFIEGYIKAREVIQNNDINKELIDKIKDIQIKNKLINANEFKKIKQALSREMGIEEKYRVLMSHLKIDKEITNEYWSFFNGLKIVRNKCNHGWPEVFATEEGQLNQHFKDYVLTNDKGMLETKFDEKFYLMILTKLYDFFHFVCSTHFAKTPVTDSTSLNLAAHENN